MQKLVVLYFIDLTFGSVGQGKVSRNDLARWFITSKPTVARFMDGMKQEGLVNQHEIGSNKTAGFIVKYSMTKEGKEYLDNHFDAAYDLYRVQVARVLAAIEAKKPEPEYRELSAKEKRQIAAGQKELL